MEWITNHWVEILNIVAYVISGASIIVKLTPTPKDDEILGTAIKFLALFSLNTTKPVTK